MSNKEKSEKKSIYKPKPVSGFPEWLPEVRLIEQQWFDIIRKVFELYGFCNIETPSVEELDVIAAKGEVDKEIYVLERLHKEEGDKEARLALHFDQTVPLARYVAQHFNDLTFPFKRYQMQRVWRGERPQAGRFREFYQCDIDVINVDQLPLHFDAEMPAIIWEVLTSLPGMENEKIQLRISNRKILSSILDYRTDIHGEKEKIKIFQTIDKKEKLNLNNFTTELNQAIKKFITATEDFKSEDYDEEDLKNDINAYLAYAERLTSLNINEQISFLENLIKALNKTEWLEFEQKENLPPIKGIGPDFIQGFGDLYVILKSLAHLPEGAVVADLSIVRGLDYYTGTVYETVFLDEDGNADHTYGSICSGGRYDDLASGYINKSLPGVGISIGFSRLFSKLHTEGKLPVKHKTPAVILMALPSEEYREEAAETARILRRRGYNVEQYHASQKIKKQLAYAEKKGIPYVWFPDLSEVKSLQTQKQYKADPREWHRRKIREG